MNELVDVGLYLLMLFYIGYCNAINAGTDLKIPRLRYATNSN